MMSQMDLSEHQNEKRIYISSFNLKKFNILTSVISIVKSNKLYNYNKNRVKFKAIQFFNIIVFKLLLLTVYCIYNFV